MDAPLQAILTASSYVLIWLLAAAASLRVGDRAPDFSLPDQNGNTVKLADFRGKKIVVLAFFLKANTPG